MLALFSRSPKNIQINGAGLVAEPKETILKAALRNGVNFPYSCKVGGCATCKCLLIEGKVKEFTDASYILSAEDLDAGYILACQSVPKTDIVISVNLTDVPTRQISGKVSAQKKLTHDITALSIELDEPMRFKAGQYAKLAVASLKDVARPYSFASKPQLAQSTVSFFIREVPGGQLSTLINQQDVLGESVVLEGPMGDFYLRESDKPMVLIAGGSGLAPILAVLQQAQENASHRPVTLLFGARTQADLYCQDEIEEIAVKWNAAFRFIQVLSDEPDDSDWSGARGWVGSEISRHASADCQAYLCGPPAMIDQSVEQLADMGVPAEHIFADRFISEHQLNNK